MIAGEVHDGIPSVEASVWLPRQGLRISIEFGIDLVATTTLISSESLAKSNLPIAFPPDDVVLVPVAGRMAVAVSAAAILSFESGNDLPVVVFSEVFIFDGDIRESRLGRDILNEWLMVYDPKGGSLLFEAV